MAPKKIDKLKAEFSREFIRMSKSYKKRKVQFSVIPELSFIFLIAEQQGLIVDIEQTEPIIKGTVKTRLNEMSLF